MLSNLEAAAKFKTLRDTLETRSPETKEAILRLQTALEKAVAEDRAETQLRQAKSLLQETQGKEAEAKRILDTKLAELQTQKDSTVDDVALAELNLGRARAMADHRKFALVLNKALAQHEAAKQAYDHAVQDAKEHPIPEADRG